MKQRRVQWDGGGAEGEAHIVRELSDDVQECGEEEVEEMYCKSQLWHVLGIL